MVKWACKLHSIYDTLRILKELVFGHFTNIVKDRKGYLSLRFFTTCVRIRKELLFGHFTNIVKDRKGYLSLRLFTTCVKIAFYSLSPYSLRVIVLNA